MTHDKFESVNRSIRTSKGERKIFLSPRIIVVIIIESHLIIRLSAALVSVWATRVETVGTDVDFSNPWHAGRYGVIVTQRGGAPSFFRPLFLARGYIRGPDAKVCAAHFNELAIPSCFPAV